MHSKSLSQVLLAFSIIVLAWMPTTPLIADDDDATEPEYLFYPLPPDLPRVQFLKSYSTSLDVSAGEGGLKSFLFGDSDTSGHLVTRSYGVAMHDGAIYVVDTKGAGWAVFDVANGKAAKVRPGGGGSLKKPTNITIDVDGTKYVTDTAREQVLVYGARNKFLRAFGEKGQFKPGDVVIVGDRLYVTDFAHHQVHVLNKLTGETLFTFGESGSNPGQLRYPINLTVSADGSLYVVDSINFRVQQFTADGEFIRVFGEAGNVPGTFSRPKGIAVDRAGYIYVVDSAFENVQIFAPDGGATMFFGAPGADRDSINMPTVVKIDYDNVRYFDEYIAPDFEVEYLVLVASQYGVNKVTVFGFGSYRGD